MQAEQVILSFAAKGVCDIKLLVKDTAGWILIEVRYDDAESTVTEFTDLETAGTAYAKLVIDELDCY